VEPAHGLGSCGHHPGGDPLYLSTTMLNRGTDREPPKASLSTSSGSTGYWLPKFGRLEDFGLANGSNFGEHPCETVRKRVQATLRARILAGIRGEIGQIGTLRRPVGLRRRRVLDFAGSFSGHFGE